MSISQNFPTIRPSLLLDFVNTKRLDPRITFTRATTATYYGTETAKAEENLLLYSQEFDNAGWSKGNVTVTANTEVAPDGTTTAETLDDDVANNPHDISQTVVTTSGSTYTLSAFLKNGTRQFAILAVSGSTTSYASAKFDLSAGTLGSTSGSGAGWSVVSSSITSVGNSWYRCTITFVVGTTIGNAARIGMGTDGTTFTASQRGLQVYTGTDATIFAWGAQLEQRSAVTAYTPTTTAPITNYIPVLETAAAGEARFDHNPTTFESLGLLIEEARTNLATYSQEPSNAAWNKTRASITADTIIAPDGTLTGDKLVEDATASNTHRTSIAAVSIVSGSSYTWSIYLKAGERTFAFLALHTGSSGNAFTTLPSFYVNLLTGEITNASATVTASSAVNVGNGWFRVSISATATSTTTNNPAIFLATASGTNSYTGDGYSGIYIWGAQLEAGAFPTSYIPTVAATVTRNADVASMTGTNFSSWFNAVEGAIITNFAFVGLRSVAGQRIITFDDGSSNNLLAQSAGSTNSIITSITDATASQMSSTSPATAFAANTQYKMGFGYALNNSVAAVNGTAGTVDTSCTIPSGITTFRFSASSTASTSNCWFQRISYYPTRLANAQLQALTA
jgi:hypothetical protein